MIIIIICANNNHNYMSFCAIISAAHIPIYINEMHAIVHMEDEHDFLVSFVSRSLGAHLVSGECRSHNYSVSAGAHSLPEQGQLCSMHIHVHTKFARNHQLQYFIISYAICNVAESNAHKIKTTYCI